LNGDIFVSTFLNQILFYSKLLCTYLLEARYVSDTKDYNACIHCNDNYETSQTGSKLPLYILWMHAILSRGIFLLC